jgi:hypothetical protein
MKNQCAEMKICARCNIEKHFSEFGNNRGTKDGFARYCKECARAKNAVWQAANPEKVKASATRWRKNNRKKTRAACLRHYYEHKDIYLARGKEWAAKNKQKVRESGRRHDAKAERKKPRGNCKERQRRYREQNIERIRARRRINEAMRRTDPIQRTIDAIRRRMRHVINGKSKGAFQLLGYTSDQLKAHLEAKFEFGMTWNNYGLYGKKWHVDHKRPVSSFKLPDKLIECFALSNLQPLWAEDNLAKRDKWE